jgi:hypothetical protein
MLSLHRQHEFFTESQPGQKLFRKCHAFGCRMSCTVPPTHPFYVSTATSCRTLALPFFPDTNNDVRGSCCGPSVSWGPTALTVDDIGVMMTVSGRFGSLGVFGFLGSLSLTTSTDNGQPPTRVEGLFQHVFLHHRRLGLFTREGRFCLLTGRCHVLNTEQALFIPECRRKLCKQGPCCFRFLVCSGRLDMSRTEGVRHFCYLFSFAAVHLFAWYIIVKFSDLARWSWLRRLKDTTVPALQTLLCFQKLWLANGDCNSDNVFADCEYGPPDVPV